MPTRHAISRIAYPLAAAILIFYTATLLLASIGFLLGFPVNRVIAPLAILIAVAAIFRQSRLAAALFPIALALSCLIAGRFYDTTFDGQLYHMETVISLADGWNPARGELTERQMPGFESRWRVNHLTRGPAIVAASLYRWLPSIEYAKGANLLLIMAAFCASLAAILRLAPVRSGTALLSAAVLALNPVAICQSLSFYVDGQTASLCLCLLALGALLVLEPDRRSLLLFCAVVVALPNAKLTTLPLAAIVGIAVMFAPLLRSRIAHRASRITSSFILLPSSLVLAIFVVGYSPFVTNALNHGHPLHPLAGPGRMTIDWTRDRPANFDNLNRLHRLLLSVLAIPDNSKTADRFAPARPAWPVLPAFHRGSLGTFAYPDARLGGFGPLYSAALLLSLLSLLAARASRPCPPTAAALLLALALLISAIPNPEMWWARYSPQLWLIPAVLIIAPILSTGRLARRLAFAALAALLANVLLVAVSYLVFQINWNGQLRAQLAELRTGPQPVGVCFNLFRSNRVRLKEAGIRFVEIAPPANGRPLFASQAVIAVEVE